MRLFWSKWRPWSTQSEPFVLKDYLQQFIAHIVFAVLWWSFGYIGKEPLSGKPTLVTPEISDKRTLLQYDRVGYMLHMLLYCFVVCHQTISIQVAHVTKQKYSPFTRIYIAICSGITVCIIINAINK